MKKSLSNLFVSTRKKLAVQSLALSLLCVSVVALAEKDAEGAEATAARNAALNWSRYATALARHYPLGRVSGAFTAEQCGDANQEKDLARYADAIEYARKMQSYSLIVWRDGVCEVAQYFPPYSQILRPESASMHKSVLGLLLAAAIADGFIESADDPIGLYVNEWEGEPRGEISLRQVATMASGLAPLSSQGGVASPAWSYVSGTGDAKALTLNRPVESEPDAVFQYSGFNSQLLLLAIESATGLPYAEYLSTRLWAPLGSRDAFTWNYAGSDNMPRAYTSLLATAEDWLRIGRLIKNQGLVGDRRLIPVALMEEFSSPSKANPNYGWQVWLGNEYASKRFYNEAMTGPSVPMNEPFDNDDMIFFDGFGGQRVYISRSEDLVVVRQGEMRIDWDDSLLPNLILRAPIAP